MDWIEWMWKVNGKWMWIEWMWMWKVESGAVPDLTIVPDWLTHQFATESNVNTIDETMVMMRKIKREKKEKRKKGKE